MPSWKNTESTPLPGCGFDEADGSLLHSLMVDYFYNHILNMRMSEVKKKSKSHHFQPPYVFIRDDTVPFKQLYKSKRKQDSSFWFISILALMFVACSLVHWHSLGYCPHMETRVSVCVWGEVYSHLFFQKIIDMLLFFSEGVVLLLTDPLSQ